MKIEYRTTMNERVQGMSGDYIVQRLIAIRDALPEEELITEIKVLDITPKEASDLIEFLALKMSLADARPIKT